ncbi:MAG TPA: hypothetical protein VEO74_05005 [Thermoanaerobaculia bacterium]|nr:hypothetical protein [Thermoanaerobaculia bacterium]
MKEFDTTLVRRAENATTFTDMEDFVGDVEARPLDKLLGDLNGLVRLPDTKFELARLVLRRRLRELDEVEREQLRTFAEEVAERAEAEAADRIRSVFVQRARA